MAAEKIGATKAVGTDQLAYLKEKDKKGGQIQTGFMASASTVPMITGAFSPSPGGQIAMA